MTNHNGNVEKRNRYQGYMCVFMAIIIVGVFCLIFGCKSYSDIETGITSWLAGMVLIGVGSNGFVIYKQKFQILDRGIEGENRVSASLNQLPNEYEVFDNIPICSGNRQSEIDSLVISKYGIWIVEVKNHRGVIYGEANSQTWVQYKDPRSYQMKNALQQANRQMSILKEMLKEKGLDTYIRVAVALPSADRVEVDSNQIYTDLDALKQDIQSYSKVCLSQNKIKQIKDLLRVQAGYLYEENLEHYKRWYSDDHNHQQQMFQQQLFQHQHQQDMFQQQMHQEEMNRFMDESMRFSMNDSFNACNDAMHAVDQNFTSPMNPF